MTDTEDAIDEQDAPPETRERIERTPPPLLRVIRTMVAAARDGPDPDEKA